MFDGPVREGARLYPQNVNISAAAAIAGIGLDRTRVVIVADPTITTHIVELEARGAFGHFTFKEDVAVSEENRKTGKLVAMAMVKSVRQLASTLVVAASLERSTPVPLIPCSYGPRSIRALMLSERIQRRHEAQRECAAVPMTPARRVRVAPSPSEIMSISLNIPRPLDDRMGDEELLVDLDTDAGLVERPHAAVLADLPRLAAQFVAELVGDRQVGLEVAAIVDRGEEMDRDRLVEPGHRANADGSAASTSTPPRRCAAPR